MNVITNARYATLAPNLEQVTHIQDIYLLTYLFKIFHFRVKEIEKDAVVYTSKEDGQLVENRLPENFVLWSTGIAMNPFTKRVSELLPNQVHFKAIEVDAHLRVKGAPLGTVYAVGDSSVVCCYSVLLTG